MRTLKIILKSLILLPVVVLFSWSPIKMEGVGAVNASEQITGFTLKEGVAAKTYWVAVNGKGDGSSANPSGSIEQALKEALAYRASADKTVKVILRDGIYRQSVNINDKTDYSGNALLILEAEHKGKATISGARELKGWKIINDREKSIYWVSLSDDCISDLTGTGDRSAQNGKVKNPWPGSVKDRGGIFINGLLKIGAKYYFPYPSSPDSMIVGTFFINYTTKKLYARLWSLEGLDQAELAVLPSIFAFNNNNNVIIRGISIEHAGWSMGTAARLGSIDNLLVEDCKFNNNRYGGLGLTRLRNVTFRNVEMSYNGGKGGGGSWGTNGYLRNVVLDKVKANYNNWINYHFAWYNYDPCGIKFAAIRQMLIKNSEFVGNFANGLWFDTEFREAYVENTTFSGNFFAGVYLEASMGPVTLTNCDIYNNDQGFFISASGSTTIDGCNIHNNNVEVALHDNRGVGRGYNPNKKSADFADIDNHQPWNSHTTNTVIKNCQISNSDDNSTPLIFYGYGDTLGYRLSMQTMTFEHNKLKFGSSGKTPFFYREGQMKYKVDVFK